MAVSFDLYVPGISPLHRLDPRVKLLLTLDLTLALFLWPTPWLVALVLVGTQLALWAAGVPWTRLRWVWAMMLPLHVLVPLAWFLFQPVGPVLLAWGPLRLSLGGLWGGLWAVLRLDALAYAAFLWLFTTEPSRMLRAFAGLGLPYSLALTLALALRYLPTVAGLYRQISDAQRARGLALDEGSWWHRLSARRPILTAVMISTLRLAQFLGWALEARALGATLPSGQGRTTWRPLRLSRADRFWLVVLIMVGVGMVGLWAAADPQTNTYTEMELPELAAQQPSPEEMTAQVRQVITQMLETMDFTFLGTADVAGRQTYKLRAVPKPGKEEAVPLGLGGEITLWVDAERWDVLGVEGSWGAMGHMSWRLREVEYEVELPDDLFTR